ncbi:GrpB family protein [Microbacterium murale]|uniref:GrpB family protein n=1 Tax=Microbacterium murale TaxID=1081040 RepID=A0ABQ1RH56_9MICO|nr:GrpB family protein [Microbacterium murale]GGD67629.1 hypothetical protein GCM10007269_08430 [Microbacterium murale]
MPLALVPYDPQWPRRFEAIAAELCEIGDPDWTIEHIGSTSVPGMLAKPIIDVAIRVTDRAEFERHAPHLVRAGWRVGSRVRTHPVMVFEEGGERTRIAHFFAAEEWDAVNQRILRDWLIAHPADARRYEDAKITAANDAQHGRGTYNAGKTAVIQEIVDRARRDRGMPSVPVYEK